MTITIPPELEELLIEKAQRAGVSVEVYIESLVREDEEWQEAVEDSLDATETRDIREAVQEGLEDVERGDTRPAAEVFAELRAKYGFPR